MQEGTDALDTNSLVSLRASGIVARIRCSRRGASLLPARCVQRARYGRCCSCAGALCAADSILRSEPSALSLPAGDVPGRRCAVLRNAEPGVGYCAESVADAL